MQFASYKGEFHGKLGGIKKACAKKGGIRLTKCIYTNWPLDGAPHLSREQTAEGGILTRASDSEVTGYITNFM